MAEMDGTTPSFAAPYTIVVNRVEFYVAPLKYASAAAGRTSLFPVELPAFTDHNDPLIAASCGPVLHRQWRFYVGAEV